MTQLSISTTQNVAINFTAATVGERMLASLIDMVIQFVYLQFMFNFVFDVTGLSYTLSQWDYWSESAVYLIFSAPAVFYTLFQEAFFEGQTLGKRIMKIKVVKIDGYQASFGDYLIRWIFRIMDVYFLFMGLFVMLFNGRRQRVGDIAAGTSVITLRNRINIDSTILVDVDEDYRPTYPLVVRLSDNDIRIIKETFESAQRTGDYQVIDRLCRKIADVAGIRNVSESQYQFIRTVIKDYNYYTRNM